MLHGGVIVCGQPNGYNWARPVVYTNGTWREVIPQIYTNNSWQISGMAGCPMVYFIDSNGNFMVDSNGDYILLRDMS